MLVQRCALDQHRLILPVSVTKPLFEDGTFTWTLAQAQYRALIDTGAQRTVVSQTVIAQQQLVRVGHMEFAGLHGPRTHSRYLASIGIWAHRIENDKSPIDPASSELSLFSLETPFEVVNMDDNANFDLILGFDVLKLFSFKFDHREGLFELIVKR